MLRFIGKLSSAVALCVQEYDDNRQAAWCVCRESFEGEGQDVCGYDKKGIRVAGIHAKEQDTSCGGANREHSLGACYTVYECEGKGEGTFRSDDQSQPRGWICVSRSSPMGRLQRAGGIWCSRWRYTKSVTCIILRGLWETDFFATDSIGGCWRN